jgi:hypothetical protein
MANWNNPTVNSNYVTFVDEVKNRDVDSARMFDGTGDNLPNLTIRWNQSNNRFERWSGTVWEGRTIGITGGGTGATTPSGARSNLELGSMATQNSNAVGVTGGSITGVSFSGTGTLTGNASTASTWQTARTLTIGATGKSVNGSNNVTWSLNEVVGFTPVQQGGGTGMGSNKIYLGWTGSILRAQVDATPFDLLHSTSGLNASNLTSGTVPTARFEQSQTISLGGSFSGTNHVRCTRTGNIITITQNQGINATAASTLTSAAGVIPASYRPVYTVRQGYHASTVNYTVTITSAGTLSIEARSLVDGSLTAFGGVTGGINLSYNVA